MDFLLIFFAAISFKVLLRPFSKAQLSSTVFAFRLVKKCYFYNEFTNFGIQSEFQSKIKNFRLRMALKNYKVFMFRNGINKIVAV